MGATVDVESSPVQSPISSEDKKSSSQSKDFLDFTGVPVKSPLYPSKIYRLMVCRCTFQRANCQ